MIRQTIATVFNRVGAVLDRIEVSLASVFLVLAVIITLWAMFYREAGGSTEVWAPQSVQYLVIWSVFLATGAALRRNVHIRVFLLVNRLPKKISHVIELVVHIIGIAACLAVAIYGVQVAIMLQRTQDRLYEFFSLPSYLFLISVPLGMGLLTFHFAERLFLLLFAPSLVPKPKATEEMQT